MISAETSLEKFVKTHQVNSFSAGFSHLVTLCCIGQPIKITNQPDHDSVILASWLQLPIRPTLFKCPLIKLSNQSVGTQTFNRSLEKNGSKG